MAAYAAMVRPLSSLLVTLMIAAGCHHDPAVHHPKPGEYPPLPPASGTPIGYIVDDAAELKLRDDQLAKLKELDSALAAQDDSIDTQLRQIEKAPEQEEGKRPQHAPAQRGRRGARHTASSGAPISKSDTAAEANKLHELQDTNDRQALTEAFAVLDDAQRIAVRKLLLDNGVEPPDEQHPRVPKSTAGSGSDGGTIGGSDVPGEP